MYGVHIGFSNDLGNGSNNSPGVKLKRWWSGGAIRGARGARRRRAGDGMGRRDQSRGWDGGLGRMGLREMVV